LKVTSSAALLILLIVLSSSLLAQSYGVPTNRITNHPADSQVVQVWFDSLPQLTILYPPAYSFNVAAKTSSGLWITSLHWDFGDGTTLDVPFSTQSQVSEIRTHQYPDQNNHCVSVTAQDNVGNVGTVSVSLMADFILPGSLPTQSVTLGVTPGNSAIYTVNVGLFCGRPVNVQLTTSSSASIIANLNPVSGTTPFSSVLTVQCVQLGTYTFSIIGTGNGVTHTSTGTLVCVKPNFWISVNPNSTYVSAQSSQVVNVTIHSINNFNSPVTLSLLPTGASNGPPNGMNVTLSQYSVTPPSNGTVTSQATIRIDCSITPQISPGTYAIKITGTSGNLVRQSYVSVQVAACVPPPSFPWWIIIALFSGLLALVLLILFIKRRPSAPLLIQQPVGYCPTCGKPMSFIEQYRTWYCYYCQRYP
jgi:hypothetical protein